MCCIVCIVSLPVLFLVGINECLENHEASQVERIPLGDKPPLVTILHSPFCPPLKKCPDTEHSKTRRRYCFDPPPAGHIYHCSNGIKENMVVEFFYKKFPCRKGEYASPELQVDQVFLSCKQCPKDRFNPEMRWSPENMDQCKAHYHEPIDKHAIEYLPGNSTHPAVSYCNFRGGWASKNKELFCWQSYKPCNCEYKGEFCFPRELLSGPDTSVGPLPDHNGSCHSWCDGQRLPENDFQCTRVTEPQEGESSQGSGVTFTTMTTTVTTPTTLTTPAQPNSERSLSTSKAVVPSPEQNTAGSSKSNGLSPGETVIILFVCLFIVGTVVVVIYKRRGLRIIDCTRNFHNTTNIDGNYVQVEGGEVNFNIHQQDEGAERVAAEQ